MKRVKGFAAFCSIAALCGGLIVSAFLYRKVAPELLPWWAIAAGFTFVGALLTKLTEGDE